MGIPENDREEAQAARDRELPPAAEADQARATAAAQEAAEPVVDAELVPEPGAELQEAVELATSAAALVVDQPADRHEGMVAMDAHDSAALLDRITQQAQEGHLAKRWVYDLPGGGGRGLTVDAVQDITQQMNWTGACSIGVRPGSLSIELIDGDEDGLPAKFWMATIEAEDRKTGAVQTGTSMEPQRLKLKPETARAKRAQGKPVPEDDRVFDKFAATKAANKAERNAMEKFIPEVVKLHLLAMAAKNPAIVERIETAQEAQIKDLPAPLDTPEAKALIEECAGIYTQIRKLKGGRGAIALPPGRYHAGLLRSQHDLRTLQSFRDWLLERRDEIAGAPADDDQGGNDGQQ